MQVAAGHGRQTPLVNHLLFQTDDLDHARDRVAQKFCSHRLDIVGARTAFRAVHHHAGGSMISLNHISYGADVLIDPGELGDFYLVQMPVAGAATIRNGRKEFASGREVASVLNADLPTRMTWWRGCEQNLVEIRKEPFHAFVERLLDRTLSSPVNFDPRIDFSRREIRRWRALAMSLFEAADARPAGVAANRIGEAFNEHRLLEALVLHQPSTVTLFLDQRRAGANPRHLKRAEEFIRANAAEPLTLFDIAAVAGVSPRTLQTAYAKAFGFSPMRALQKERMRRVRHELVAADGDGSVSETAASWGFSHMGRFAADYRREFGELPAATARRPAYL